ncbi:hypothetical protein VHA01S_080_00020 [Vibrio halioticoli NBRC 102217]|uniref:Uncharacterized protein n=1 Tax=Vibrio halioticoli NBRC 102217 TaxID=1219072 RepID=V5FRI2_9VIBR|nr:IS110 family transposase [Vibrio halioticoli]GAD91262.1 hypothetical protein VHA01S_080_00020 [Vibrio halioticoli NBRC 102217]
MFESSGGSNYWNQLATDFGHQSRLISSRLVSAIRQNQKTDKSDTLAIIQASQLPDIKFASGKTNSQQQAQSMLKLREQAIKQKTALKNQLKGLMREFNLPVGCSHQSFILMTELILEDEGIGKLNAMHLYIGLASGDLGHVDG